MPRTLIDISVPLQNDVPPDPPGNHPTIQYIDHQQGLPRMLQFFDSLKAEDLPVGQGWAGLSSRSRYPPTTARISTRPGTLPDGYVATTDDVAKELKRIGHTPSPLEIVVVNTSAGAKFGQANYVNSGCG